MMYIKDGVVYRNLKYVTYDGKQIFNPSDEQIQAAGYTPYTPERTLGQAIAEKIAQIQAYDASENVNVFYYGETKCWLDKATRVGLMNSTNMEKTVGRQTSKLILGDLYFDFPCDTILYMLTLLEVYAKDCYDVTAQHVINVKNLTDIDSVDNYDYTAGYPDKLNFYTNKESAVSISITGDTELLAGNTYQYAIETNPGNIETKITWSVEKA